MSVTTPAIPGLSAPPLAYLPSWMGNLTFIVNALVGKANNVSTVTLAANAATTTLTDPRLGAFSVITFMAQTANAAAVAASIYVTGQAKGAATIHHTNDANTDKTFGIAIHG